MSLRGLILHFLSPERRRDAEAESRQWVATCPRCQARNSVWDVGGVRFKGVGRPTVLARCPSCGKTNPHRFERAGG